jgi:hypothetical protein
MWAALAVGAVARGCGGERCAGWTREHGGDLVGMLGRWSSPYIYIYIYGLLPEGKAETLFSSII